MNKKGFIDFDMEDIVPIGLAVVGAGIAWFTLSGGFAPAVTGESFSPVGGIWMKIFASAGAGVIGFIWGRTLI